MKTLRRILTVSSIAVIGCALSNATTLTTTVSCSTSSGSTELGPASNGTINCGNFNESLGTLTGISLTLTGTVLSTSTVSGTNNDNSPHSGIVNANSNFLVDSSSTSSLANFGISNDTADFSQAPFSTGMFNVNAPSGTMNLLANNNTLPTDCSMAPTSTPNTSCEEILNVTGSNSRTGADSNGATFTLYESALGTGTYSFTADTITQFQCGISGGNVGCGQVTNDSFTGSVTYTYSTPSTVPEPTTLFLMGSALVGCGLLRKRTKKS